MKLNMKIIFIDSPKLTRVYELKSLVIISLLRNNVIKIIRIAKIIIKIKNTKATVI